MAELMPCPFCGSEAKYVISDHVNSDTTRWHKIMCKDVFGCGAELGDALSGYSPDYEDQVQKLKDKWNRRVVNNDLVSRNAATDVLCDACGNVACPAGLTPRCSYYDKMQAIPPAEGRLIVLPCKVGDTVYWNTGLDIVKARVADFIIDGAMQLRLNLPTLDIAPVYPHDRLFLVREEAEAALEEAGWLTVDPSLGGNFGMPKA